LIGISTTSFEEKLWNFSAFVKAAVTSTQAWRRHVVKAMGRDVAILPRQGKG
jgi:hypothetical protein